MARINRRNFWKVGGYLLILESIYRLEVDRDETLDCYRQNLGADFQSNLDEDKAVIEMAVFANSDFMGRHGVSRPENSQLIEYLQEIKPIAAELRKQRQAYLEKTEGNGFLGKIPAIINILPVSLKTTRQNRKIKKKRLDKLL